MFIVTKVYIRKAYLLEPKLSTPSFNVGRNLIKIDLSHTEVPNQSSQRILAACCKVLSSLQKQKRTIFVAGGA